MKDGSKVVAAEIRNCRRLVDIFQLHAAGCDVFGPSYAEVFETIATAFEHLEGRIRQLEGRKRPWMTEEKLADIEHRNEPYSDQVTHKEIAALIAEVRRLRAIKREYGWDEVKQPDPSPTSLESD